MDETDDLKALNLLVHDLRAPLSVAQGFLRLLLQGRLVSDAERERAIQKTMEALGRIDRLCEDAAAYASEEGPAAARFASEAQLEVFVAEVDAVCQARCAGSVTFDITRPPLVGRIRGVQLDRVAQSMAVILCAVRRSDRSASVRVSVRREQSEVWFLLGSGSDALALAIDPPESFDPWSGGHGLALPVACRAVRRAGGRIWTSARARGAVGIALPEEAPVP